MIGDNGKRSPGQPFTAPPARIWNDMVDAGQAIREGLFNTENPGRVPPRSTDVIKIKNNTGAIRTAGQIVGFNGSALSQCTPENIWLIAQAAQINQGFGVLRYSVATGEFIECQVSGVCIAKVNILDTGHKYANVPAAGGYVLESVTSGPVAILWHPGSTGEADCVVVLQGGGGGGGGSTLVRFEMVENWTAGEADADITEMDGTAIAVPGLLRDPELIFTSLVSGNRGLAISQDGNYYIIQADCDQ